MFSSNQKIFALLFAIVFIIAIVWSYRKDLKLHKIHYKKVWVVGLGIALVFAAFAITAFILHD
tara:strand:+ start:86436 stop:86624 length:189 start_codon:yes stop_codon:yes gene_type:complete